MRNKMININALNIQHSAKTRFGGVDRHYRQTATKGSQEGAVPAKTRQVREMGQRNREVFKD